MATVSALTYYPVKGCAGVSVDRAVVTEAGLAHDRSFMVIEPDGGCATQRTRSRLALARAQVLHAGAKLALSASDTVEVVVDVLPDGPRRPVRVHKWPGTGVDQGDEAAEWFSDLLGAPVRLVRVPPGFDRVHAEGHGRVSFADSTAMVVISLSSLDELNTRILERGAEPVPMNRFRPNVVVTGWPEPHTEDRVRRMSVGDAEFGYVKKDVRCVVTMVDQLTGQRAGPEPLRTLADYRREPDGGVSFGMKASVLRTGVVNVADEIVVSEWL